jgi:hypothetical protein
MEMMMTRHYNNRITILHLLYNHSHFETRDRQFLVLEHLRKVDVGHLSGPFKIITDNLISICPQNAFCLHALSPYKPVVLR